MTIYFFIETLVYTFALAFLCMHGNSHVYVINVISQPFCAFTSAKNCEFLYKQKGVLNRLLERSHEDEIQVWFIKQTAFS